MESNLISGIYMVYIRWDLIWFENRVLNKVFTVKEYELHAILLKHFDSDYCEKILESIHKYEKVIIDFDQNIVKKVIEKDVPFIDNMKQYFSASNLEYNFNPETRSIDLK